MPVHCPNSIHIVPDAAPPPPALFTQMQASYSAAFAPGTHQNRTRQTRAYLTYMVAHNRPVYNPTDLDILLYTQFLANSLKSPATVRNYISGAKTFLQQQGTSVAPFMSPFLLNLFKGITRLSTHTPIPAPVIDLPRLKCMCDVLTAMDHEADTARTAILLGFTTLLRQSNLLPATVSGQEHCIRRRDCVVEDDTLWVTINSTKTIFDPAKRVIIPVAASPSKYCPVAAWLRYTLRVPLDPDAPALMLSPVVPLTPQKLNAYMRTTLAMLALPEASKVTVHSLRRSGAQAAAANGASREHLMIHGTWASSAINSYVPQRLYTEVPQIMSLMFGQ